MAAVKLCLECKVPRKVTREHQWLDNGTIVERKNPSHRMLFFESDNLPILFGNIETILGRSLERFIIESQRYETFDYLVPLIPDWQKRVVRWIGIKPFARKQLTLSKIVGYGNVELVSVRYRGDAEDHLSVTIEDPWFITSYCGVIAGGVEAVTGHEADVNCEELGDNKYRVTSSVSPRSMELRGSLKSSGHHPKSGDLTLERCPSCGCPRAISRFEWNTERGTIENAETGQRMVFISPREWQALFDQLESDMGKDMPEVIVEAQRRFVTDGRYLRDDIRQETDLREHFAVRGLGNLRKVELGRERLYVRLENSCLPLLMAGLIQGFFELIFGREGEVEWELADDGDLEVEVT